MKIKRFNESIERKGEIWVALIYSIDFPDKVSFSSSFPKEIMAYDFIIKYTNSFFKTKFEPFFDSDKERLFVEIEENEDWDNCVEYCRIHDMKFDIVPSKINDGPI
jgi:hypothetical protein